MTRCIYYDLKSLSLNIRLKMFPPSDKKNGSAIEKTKQVKVFFGSCDKELSSHCVRNVKFPSQTLYFYLFLYGFKVIVIIIFNWFFTPIRVKLGHFHSLHWPQNHLIKCNSLAEEVKLQNESSTASEEGGQDEDSSVSCKCFFYFYLSFIHYLIDIYLS